MANTLELGNGKWATGKDTVLAFNDENNNFKPLPFDFTRDTVATVVNKAGLIETVGSGEPRIDFSNDAKGALLLEPTRSNIVTYSELFNTYLSARVDTTITDNYGVSPDGSLNSSRIQFIDDTSYCYAGLSISTSHTASCYVKGVQGEIVRFGIGSTIATGSLFTFNGEWQRIEYTTSSATQIFFSNYNGANTSDFEVFGLQLEQGSYATSYIPNFGNSAGATRSADSSSQTPPSGIIGQTEGTLFIHLKDLKFNLLGTNLSTIILDAGLYYTNSIGFASQVNGDIRVSKYTSGTQSTIDTITLLDELKIAVSYNSTSIIIYVNGQLSLSSSNTSALYTRLVLNNATRESKFYIPSLGLYNTILSNSELQALTTI